MWLKINTGLINIGPWPHLPFWEISSPTLCLGILALNLPGLAARAGTRLDLLPEESVPLSLASFTLLLILLPFLPIRMTPVDGDTIQCLACLQLSVILAAISLYNISLALFLALSYVPLAILATKLEKWSISRVFTM